MKIGDRVTYDDEPEGTDMLGTVSEPTTEEIAHAKTYEYPVGPEQGDVVVQWDEGGERTWEDPSDLVVIQKAGA